MKVFQGFVSCVAVVGLLAGCTVTKCKLTGSPGAAYKGYHRMNDQKDRESDSGKLPDFWFEVGCSVGFWRRLEECEYQKFNTNDCLMLKVRTHGFKGTIAAPPGTEGVRVSREGKAYRMETF